MMENVTPMDEISLNLSKKSEVTWVEKYVYVLKKRICACRKTKYGMILYS